MSKLLSVEKLGWCALLEVIVSAIDVKNVVVIEEEI
jgi:hypothetical protein